MDSPNENLKNAPIIEAIIDIECDMRPGFTLPSLEKSAGDLFRKTYPTFRAQHLQEHSIQTKPGASPRVSVRNAIQAFQFFSHDGKQLIQVRLPGYSFNRLRPYGSLDDYLPEIERTWRMYVGLVAPVQVRAIRLRYINRILVPLKDGKADLDQYIKLGPRLPDEDRLTISGFLNQHTAVDRQTGDQATTVLATQPQENDRLPIIFDNGVMSFGRADPEDWNWILAKIVSLRDFKNRIFRNTLTPQCLSLFQ